MASQSDIKVKLGNNMAHVTVHTFLYTALGSCTHATVTDLTVCLRNCCPVVFGHSVLRTILRDLSTSGQHSTASQTRRHGSALCLDLFLHLDLPAGAGLEQIYRQQDWDNLRA